MWQVRQENAMSDGHGLDPAGSDAAGSDPMRADPESADPGVETFSQRLIRREARRRAAMELSTTTPAGLESTMARISAEVTAEAAEAKAAAKPR
jgi:hypothetical protein